MRIVKFGIYKDATIKHSLMLCLLVVYLYCSQHYAIMITILNIRPLLFSSEKYEPSLPLLLDNMPLSFHIALAIDIQYYYTNKVERDRNHFAPFVKCITCCRYCHNFSRTFITITIF
jgi:hypothetical protein